jgi:hypothetical protein
MSYKIFRYFDGVHLPQDDAPLGVDYVTGLNVRLHPIHTWERGRIIRVDWFATYSVDANGEEQGDDLVVCETLVYTDDASGLARHRLQKITWYLEDGTPGQSKTREKIYGNAASRTEGRRRRRNVIDNMSIKVVGMLAATETDGDVSAAIDLSRPFLDALSSEVSMYVESGATALHAAIVSSTVSWLANAVATNTTIRDYILGELA